MNNRQVVNLHASKRSNIRFFPLALLALLISACARPPIIVMETSVVQVNNLHDFDSDGVIKARDKCKDTVLGANIDNDGCGTQTANIQPLNINIKFANNSYEIPDTGYAEIEKLADFLNKHQTLDVVIEGHTSKTGSTGLNQTLSDNRAKAVARVLVNSFNIPKYRVSSIGFGFKRPEQTGDSEQVHAVNRRIMAELAYTDHQDEMMWTIYTVDQTE
ncbi:OmpA family protein [Thalassomonas actiniarum]|uniref:OmpA family protein n=1 Tax=Thalassomonas actiniarum TaxID=485447 RepID=A0AAE9YZY7_9GAMM|nr:OmpA family protein [Thalassomonas actiniarum]WDE02648.1 OmpA family protein [Thalassomonas actiniarum]